MSVLVDTNVLLRLLQPHHPHCVLAEKALASLRRKGENLYVAAQNLVEVWSVITRPVQENGLGFSVQQALADIDNIKRLFVLLPELPLLDEWKRLVVTYRVSGKNAHDARLVAAMTTSGVSDILTLNSQDFARYDQITVIDPRSYPGT